jgi:hypothetical protein
MYRYDPRFHTNYQADYQGPWLQHSSRFYIPSIIADYGEYVGCGNSQIPGYRQKRDDKGFALTINDYPFHNIYFHGGIWDEYVYTPNLQR